MKLRRSVAAPVKLVEPVSGDPRVRAEIALGPTEVNAGIELATATLRTTRAPDMGTARFETTIHVSTGWDNHPTIEAPVFIRAE